MYWLRIKSTDSPEDVFVIIAYMVDGIMIAETAVEHRYVVTVDKNLNAKAVMEYRYVVTVD